MITCNYYTIAVVSILFLVMCLLHLEENDIFSIEVIRKFKILIYFIIFEILIDTIFEILSGNTSVSKSVLYVIKSIQLSANPIMVFLVLEIFNSKKLNRKKEKIEKIRKILKGVIVINTVLQITSFQGKYFFYIDENHLYQRGSLVLLYIIILLFSMSLLLYAILLFSTNTQSIMKCTLFSFFFTICFGLLLRSIFPRTNFDWLCVSVSILFLLIYYSAVTSRIDPLTKLLNRLVYSRLIERINYTALIIMIDANNLKLINDTRGHKAGDKTIKVLGSLIFKAYKKDAYCFRLGGDEFCVILKPNFFDKLLENADYDENIMKETFLCRLDELILEQTEKGNDHLKYGVARGCEIYYTLSDCIDPEDWIPFPEVVACADKNMYENKKKLKEKFIKECNNINEFKNSELIESSVKE